MALQNRSMVALGGIGGSGTRLGAAVLQMLGYHLGSDLNEALDNLWFSLLFKRRELLVFPEEIAELYSVFIARMHGELRVSDEQRRRVLELAVTDRIQHGHAWLSGRAISFLAASYQPIQVCAWKEPNTHIFIDRFLEIDPTLKYIHFERNPVYMSHSRNQNQLENWGPIFLNRSVSRGPSDSLSYWCAVHRRMVKFKRRWSDRILIISYDALIARPRSEAAKIAYFLDTAPLDDSILKELIGEAVPSTQPLVDSSAFRIEDVDYVRKIGYPIELEACVLES